MRNGRKMTSEELGSLPNNKRARLEKGKSDSAQLLTRWQTEKRNLHDEEAEQIGRLDHGVVPYTITPMINELLVKYNDGPSVHFSEAMRSYLEGVRDDLIRNSDAFKSEDEQHWGRYHVNVLVDNQNSKHAPIVFDYNPGYHNLFGRIDRAHPNAPTDDFMLIKPGSLHRATEATSSCRRVIYSITRCRGTRLKKLSGAANSRSRISARRIFHFHPPQLDLRRFQSVSKLSWLLHLMTSLRFDTWMGSSTVISR